MVWFWKFITKLDHPGKLRQKALLLCVHIRCTSVNWVDMLNNKRFSFSTAHSDLCKTWKIVLIFCEKRYLILFLGKFKNKQRNMEKIWCSSISRQTLLQHILNSKGQVFILYSPVRPVYCLIRWSFFVLCFRILKTWQYSFSKVFLRRKYF